MVSYLIVSGTVFKYELNLKSNPIKCLTPTCILQLDIVIPGLSSPFMTDITPAQ